MTSDLREAAVTSLHAKQRSILDQATEDYLDAIDPDISVLVSATLLTASSLFSFAIDCIDREHPESHQGYDAIDQLLQELIAENRNRQTFGPMIAVVSE